MIFDFHTHVQRLAGKGVSGAVSIPLAFPGQMPWEEVVRVAGVSPKPAGWRDFLAGELFAVNKFWRLGVGPGGVFVPWVSVAMSPERLAAEAWFAGAGVIKIIPVLEHAESRPAFVSALAAFLAALPDRKVVMIHTGWGSPPALYEPILDRFPDRRFVLAHMKEDGDEDNDARQRILRRFPLVSLETSYLSSPKRVGQYVAAGFADRLLFGSDYRTPADECTLAWQIDAIRLAPVSGADRDRIFWGNASRLLAGL